MLLHEGLAVVRTDDYDPDAIPDDYPLEGIVTSFARQSVLGEVVFVQHGDYVERIRRDLFEVYYRAA